MITVPVEIEIILFWVVVVEFMVNDPVLRVPLPTAIVKLVLVETGLAILIPPFTTRELVPLIVKLPVLIVVNELQVAATLTVIVIPLLIVTASLAVGIACPPHVAVAFQFPETEAVRVAPLAMPTPIDRIKKVILKNNLDSIGCIWK